MHNIIYSYKSKQNLSGAQEINKAHVASQETSQMYFILALVTNRGGRYTVQLEQIKGQSIHTAVQLVMG